MDQLSGHDTRLVPYVPALLLGWRPTGSDPRHMRVRGSLVFVDISGFTRLTERLSRRGKIGAEEMSDILDATFAELLREAAADGADLVKWGGDAVLLLFRGPGHAPRAARAAHRMRACLRQVGRITTAGGTVRLRMSVGVHSGDFDFFLVGDPEVHRELLVCGPDASTTAEMEAAADAGQIGLSAAAAALLPPAALGDPVGAGRLLRSVPADVPDIADGRSSSGAAWAVEPQAALPPPIRAHLLSRAGEAEHRSITVAFVQFAGVDELLAGSGPGALAAALDDVVRNVQHACAVHEVTFFESDINRDGGKIMLTAGAPRSADHLEERMLRAAREILDHAGRLPLRIGINRGHVFAGDFGPAFRRTYSVKGDAINLAARLLGKAAPGQAIATLPVFAASQTEFRAAPLPPFTVKGKSRPVLAAAVGDLLGARTEGDPDVALVDRDRELGVLAGCLEEARSGRGGSVRVVGEAGIGKTRLVTELLRDTGARVLSCRCEAYESSTPYFPFRKVLREALDLPADPARGAAELPGRVAQLAPVLEPWAPLLGIPLDLPVAATRETAELDPSFVRPRLERLVVEVLDAALRGTAAIVVEDVQHVDDASASLLRRLEEAADDRPWLVLVTRREGPLPLQRDAPPDEVDRSCTTVRLGALGEGATHELARRLAADHPLTPHALGMLVRRSGGNPMFLTELVTAARGSADVDELPDTVEALITSEVDRLSPTDRRALRAAAVLGSVVDEAAWARLLTEENALDGHLLRRLDRFLVRGQSGRLRFRSALLRDVAYEGLPYRRRRVLHQRVGDTLEGEAADPEALAEVLSLHFFHAGNAAKAWHYSLVAGRRAVTKNAHGDAIGFFERATGAVPQDGSVTPGEHSAALEQLADSRFLVGLTTEATEAYAAARRVVRDDPVRQAFLVEKEVRVDLRRRRFPQAMRRLARGLHVLEGRTGQQAQVARSLLARRYAYSRFAQGRTDEALQWAERAAAEAEESLDKGALAQAYEMLNAIHVGAGRPEPLPYGRLALQANRELGDLAPQGHCLNNLAVDAFTHGRWAEALEEYRRAGEIFRRIGDSASEGNAAYNQAELLVRQGRFAEAAELLPTVLLVARAVEDDELVALALREQAQTLAGAGDVDAGLQLLAQARERFVELEETDELVVTDLVRSETLLTAGRWDDAEELLTGLLPPEGPGALDGSAARWHRLSAAVRAGRDDLDAARAELLAGLERATAAEDRFEEALLLRDLVELARRRGLPDVGEAAARSAELLASMGVLSAR